MSLFRNLRLAGATVRTHLLDDPAVLTVQLSRRLPHSFTSTAAKALVRVRPNSVSAPTLLAHFLTGSSDELSASLARVCESKPSARQARWAAEVAIAAGLPDWADRLLPLAAGDPKSQATLARRLWYAGDMSGAITSLDGTQFKRQQRRLKGELAVYSGWEPSLVPRAMTPIPGRVLHLLTNSLPHTGSGYAQRSHSILTAQQDAGLDVLAATRLGYPVQVGKVFAADSDEVDGVTYRRLIPAKLAPTADARLQQEAQALLDLAVQFRPEVLHTTTHFANGLVVGAVAKALGIPWVYEVRGQLADTWASTRGPEALKSERYRLFQERETSVMNNADALVTLGESMRQGIVARGISADAVSLAPNAVGGVYLEEPDFASSACAAVGLDPERSYIGTVSSLVDYEGIDHLIEAFALLAPDFPQLRLLIVGDGAAAPLLRAQAAESGVGGSVIFTGRVPREQAHLYHQAMEVFVVPRKDLDVTRAVTPLKPVEALASSRPVVASDLSALREIIEPGLNGSLVPAGNPELLALALKELLLDASLRANFGANGRDLVLNTRTWGANAQQSIQTYAQIIGKGIGETRTS